MPRQDRPAKPKARRASGKAAVRAPQAKPAKRGRPTGYTQALGDQICELLAMGRTLREACAQLGQKESTVRGWALDEEHAFFRAYARAREIGIYAMVDEIILISDDSSDDWKERINQKGEKYLALDRDHVKRSELRIRTREWIAERVLPAVFGTKVEVGGSPDKPVQVVHDVADAFIGRIAGIAARIGTSQADQRPK